MLLCKKKLPQTDGDKMNRKKMPKIKLVSKRTMVSFICSIMACLLLLINFLMTVPIEKDCCKTVSTTFEYCKIVRGRYAMNRGMHIYCSDSEDYYVNEFYLGHGLKERIEEFEKGADLILVVDDYDNMIVELSADNEILYSYSDYIKDIETERKGTLALFIFILLFPVLNGIRMYKEINRFNNKPRKK